MAARGGLSLHEATMVSSLLGVTLFSAHFIEPWRERSPDIFMAQFFRFLAFTALKLWISLKGPCFGNRQACNMCIYTLGIPMVGPQVRAVYTLIYGLIFSYSFYRFALIGPGYALGAVWALVSEEARENWVNNALNNAEYSFMKGTWSYSPSTNYLSDWLFNDDTVAFTVFKSKGKIHGKLGFLKRVYLALRIARCGRTVVSLIGTAIYIRSLENFIWETMDQKAKEWGYGQISAIILSGPPAMALLCIFAGSLKEFDPLKSVKFIYPICLVMY
jgi:hypothetical protein